MMYLTLSTFFTNNSDYNLQKIDDKSYYFANLISNDIKDNVYLPQNKFNLKDQNENKYTLYIYKPFGYSIVHDESFSVIETNYNFKFNKNDLLEFSDSSVKKYFPGYGILF